MALAGAGCGVALEDGRYACMIGTPDHCPPGWVCQPTGTTGAGRCYQAPLATADAALDAAPPQDARVADGGLPSDAQTTDAYVEVDAEGPCTGSPIARTSTTLRRLDGLGADSAEPIEVGATVTVNIDLEVLTPPSGSIGFLELDLQNLTLNETSVQLDGVPTTLPSPFQGRLPLILAAGIYSLSFEANVQNQVTTVRVSVALSYGPSGSCPIPGSGSLVAVQVLGGIEKDLLCHDLDALRSLQVTPFIPLQSLTRYEAENGRETAVLIDNLVVGGPDCPGAGVLVHQVQLCLIRADGSTTVSLSGDPFGGASWFVDDLLLVEVLDTQEQPVAAFTTYQITSQVLGCCASPPCESAIFYAPGGPTLSITNLVQGGGNNGPIGGGGFDLTPYLPVGAAPFHLRITALDQGVEGALDRVFVNVTP